MNKSFLGIVVGIFFVSFLYRIYGATISHPFWVDEFSTAHQADLLLRAPMQFLTHQFGYTEINKLTSTILASISMGIFGRTEWAIRMPFILIGSLVPVFIFILANYITNKRVAISATLLSVFSYFFITWSRQARSYVIQQLLVLVMFWLYFYSIDHPKKNKLSIVTLIIVSIIGIFTHPFIYLVIASIVIHFSFINRHRILTVLKKPLAYLFGGIFLVLLFISGSANMTVSAGKDGFLGLHSNLWYYHSFLWREYALVSFLGITGLIVGLLNSKKYFSLIALYILIHLIFIFFIFGPYVSRYLLVIFPFLFIGMAYSIDQFLDLFITKNKWKLPSIVSTLLPAFIILCIIINGHKFVTKPKSYYSVNHDFREIALIDYHYVYDVIKNKGDLNKGQTAVIDTWADRLNWYLGSDYSPAFFFNWEKGPGSVNGLARNNRFIMNDKQEKVIFNRPNIGFISTVTDLQKTIEKYPKGFIFIDDSSLPPDVIEYAEKNLKKELYLDHYPLDDNPYSIWPATLYSWGIK